ncbi:MAG TPA: hypothetical protein VHW23_27570 [Kofleriaceae bacterium]|nr:hypothetical protein [Kofleriaceae bacterium]
MRRVPTLALLAGLAGAPAPAFADPASPAASPTPAPGTPFGADSDCARARKAGKPCQLTIGPEQVGGARPVPDGTDLRLRRFEPAGSMLRTRHDFIAQIVQSAEDL